MNEIQKLFNVGRNTKQISHTYHQCIDVPFGKHIFDSNMFICELIKYKRKIRKHLKSIKDKDRLRNFPFK